MLDEAETEHRPSDSTSSASAIDGGRFIPGTILDARYRIVALLGRGGMGEVYRAEDLKLGEQVALKFLPQSLGADGAALARFHREVRTARGIAHPNVVRVYDIGEQDGQPFLSMEYVDGEDLSLLLKRIGHLPGKKGVELARQLCAGLAAAHQAGVLHRDLKPANVMIDGEGRAKISDFGLADLAEALDGPDGSGTPPYMAPEQLAHGRSSFASDIYSLGLVLYEMFTGERPFRADSRQDLISRQRESEPPAPSSHVEALDPLVERAILQCLAREPEDRPSSPLQVAAALPGGDPLAAALAAGETPSPEMVERAAVAGTLSRPRAWGLLATALLGILAYVAVSDRQTTLYYDGVPLKPQVLEHQAEELLAGVGWPEGSRGLGRYVEARSLFSLVGERRSRDEWRALASDQSTFFEYLYRVGPEGISPTRRWASSFTDEDPSPREPGMATVLLDSRGRLRELLAVPASDALVGSEGAPDWSPLFDAAQLDPARWTPVDPRRAPPVHATSLWAWSGSPADEPQKEFIVEAASRGGRIVFWRLSEAGETPDFDFGSGSVFFVLAVFATLLLLAAWQAFGNLRSGRGDRRGSLRIALASGAASLVSGLANVVTLTRGAELSLYFAVLSGATFIAAAVWLLYMAIEPLMRRHYPQGLVSWSRVLAGRFNDPLIGRDLLVGLALTALLAVLFWAPTEWALRSAEGGVLRGGYPHGLNALLGPTLVIANLFQIVQILIPLGLMFLYVAPRLVIRNSRLATLAGALALFGFAVVFHGGLNFEGVLWGLFLILVCSRVGFVGLVALVIFMNNLVLTPASLDTSAWWAPKSWIGIAVVIALAIWAFRNAVERPTQEAN